MSSRSCSGRTACPAVQDVPVRPSSSVQMPAARIRRDHNSAARTMSLAAHVGLSRTQVVNITRARHGNVLVFLPAQSAARYVKSAVLGVAVAAGLALSPMEPAVAAGLRMKVGSCLGSHRNMFMCITIFSDHLISPMFCGAVAGLPGRISRRRRRAERGEGQNRGSIGGGWQSCFRSFWYARLLKGGLQLSNEQHAKSGVCVSLPQKYMQGADKKRLQSAKRKEAFAKKCVACLANRILQQLAWTHIHLHEIPANDPNHHSSCRKWNGRAFRDQQRCCFGCAGGQRL